MSMRDPERISNNVFLHVILIGCRLWKSQPLIDGATGVARKQKQL